MAGQDKEDVARAASGRWRQILLSLCPGLSADALSGVHERACPRCGGHTRFRPFNDFDERGGLMCSHCHADRNADGFAALQWWNSCDFVTALKMVADFLGLASSAVAGHGQSSESGRRNPQPPQPEDWDAKWSRRAIGAGQQLDWLSQWCQAKPPIVPESLVESGVMFGSWPRSQQGQSVIGFHGFGADSKNPNSLLLYRADGSMFPALGKLGERKTHLVGGSQAGWIHVGGLDRTRAADIVWRVEGLPDGLALLPLLPANHGVVTPSCGCGWNKKSPERNPPLDIFAGKVVIGVGDADSPGQRGLWRFATDAAVVATRVFLATLPFPVEETHGKDLRDWIGAGVGYPEIQRSLGDFERIRRRLDEALSLGGDAPVCEPLTNYVRYGKGFSPRPVREIQEQLWAMTDSWPRRVDGRLFVHDGPSISWLNNQSALCAWFGLKTGATVDFVRDGGVYSKGELFEALQQSAKEYEAVENVPHEPQMPGHYYACGEFPDGAGEHLAWLLDRFCVAEEADRDLICLLMATVFWGGGGGQRPAFMITANGTGAGKTTLASVVAELAGGMISVGQRDSMRDITERMLTAEGRDKRILFVDNIKATRFSSAEIEALVTAPVISGRELYKGESQRPNTLTWIMTMNGVGLSKDIADRVVVIRLKRPEYSGNWADETTSYVREHRKEIICDLMSFLRGPRDRLSIATRWGAWTEGVLSRLPLPEPAAMLIQNRQKESDVDGDEASMVQEYFRDRLLDLRYNPDAEMVFIPSRIANKWHAAAVNERPSVTKSVQWLRTQIEQGAIACITVTRKKHCRGFVWRGEHADLMDEIRMDLEDEVERDGFTRNNSQ